MDAAALRSLFEALESRRAGAVTRIQFPGADLSAAHLLCADLQGANLTGARLDRAKLAGANLTGALLDKASFCNADLTGADLRGADLSGAKLTGALLTAADLRGAKVPKALGAACSIDGARFDAACCARSGLDEATLVALSGAGAAFDDIDALPPDLRQAIATAAAHATHTPRNRRRGEIEVEAARQRQAAPSSRRALVARGDAPPSSRPSGQQPRPSSRSRSSAELAAPGDALAPGRVILGVTLVEQVGEGPASVVWWGNDTAGSPAAVKCFKPPWRDVPPMRSAFASGVRAMRRLSAMHELPTAIARIHRADADDLAFVTTYESSGNALDLPSLGWNARAVAKFFEQICHAIEAAHQAGLLHRCLKPSNILLGDELRPVVTDFGMIDLETVGRWSTCESTHALYAAPEELAGKSTGGPAADIFSLGRLLQFMLSGADPEEPAADLPELRALRGQPSGLVRIVRRCTMREPSARYQTVGELLAALAQHERDADVRVGAGAADEAPPPSQTRRAVPAAARRRDEPGEPPASRRRPELTEASRRADEGTAPPSSRITLPSVSVRAAEIDVAPSARSPVLPSRRVELALAAVGGAMLAGFAAAVALTHVPTTALLDAAHVGAAVAAALLTLAVPPLGVPGGAAHAAGARLVPAALVAALVYAVDPSRLSAIRLRATLSGADPAARAAAVRELVRSGHRSFEGADLSDLDLSGADLSQASFRGTSLARANLSGAALMESTFDGADLSSADVRGADLSGTNADLARGFELVTCDAATALPGEGACVDGRPERGAQSAQGPGLREPDDAAVRPVEGAAAPAEEQR